MKFRWDLGSAVMAWIFACWERQEFRGPDARGGKCYGLNHVLSKFTSWGTNFHYLKKSLYLDTGTLKRSLSSSKALRVNLNPSNLTGVLWRGNWTHRETLGYAWKSQERGPWRNQITNTLTLDFSFQTYKKINSCCSSHLVCWSLKIT